MLKSEREQINIEPQLLPVRSRSFHRGGTFTLQPLPEYVAKDRNPSVQSLQI